MTFLADIHYISDTECTRRICLFTVERGISRSSFPDRPEDYRFEDLVAEDDSFFVPATTRRTPKLTRQRIYTVAASRGFKVSVHMATKEGVDGFRVYRHPDTLLGSNYHNDGVSGGPKA